MRRQFTYDLEPGRIYVTIAPAQEDRERRGDYQVTILTPHVEVSTKPLVKENGDRDTETPQGFLAFASQAYRLHDAYRLTTEHELKVGWIHPWTTGGLRTYDRGVYRKSGTYVESGSPARKKVEGAIMSALTAFALEVPDWEQRSIALHLEGEWEQAMQQEDRAVAALEKAQTKAAETKAALMAHLTKHGIEMEDKA